MRNIKSYHMYRNIFNLINFSNQSGFTFHIDFVLSILYLFWSHIYPQVLLFSLLYPSIDWNSMKLSWLLLASAFLQGSVPGVGAADDKEPRLVRFLLLKFARLLLLLLACFCFRFSDDDLSQYYIDHRTWWRLTSHDSNVYLKAHQESSSRIVNGDDAPVGRFPYLVSLQDPDGSHFCGGTLIGKLVCSSARSRLFICFLPF